MTRGETLSEPFPLNATAVTLWQIENNTMKPFHTLTPLPAGKSALVLSVLGLATFLAAGACDQKTSTTGSDYDSGTSARSTDSQSRTTTTATPNNPSTRPGTGMGMGTTGRNGNSSAGNQADADNTARNRRDASGNTKTSMDQSESSEHIKMTADIRRAVVGDDTLSTTAQNCKIITDEGGMVTLRGPVTTQAEKDNIGAKARMLAGNERVNNELEVETK